MDSIQRTERRALCPTCGRLATIEIVTSTEPVMRAIYKCVIGHLWGEHWQVLRDDAA